jgi:hypothetical protein
MILRCRMRILRSCGPAPPLHRVGTSGTVLTAHKKAPPERGVLWRTTRQNGDAVPSERAAREACIVREALSSLDQTERPSCENKNAESTERNSAT